MIFTKTLAVVGALLAWFPVAATVLTSGVVLIQRGFFRLDWLMPAELFPFALVGGGLLLWAALRAHSRRGLIGWGLGLAVGFLVGGQVFATVSGLASGRTQPTGWIWGLVVASLIAYVLALLEMGVGGLLLMFDLFKRGE